MSESRKVPYIGRGRVVEPPNYLETFGNLTALRPPESLELIGSARKVGLISGGASGLARGLITDGLTRLYGTPGTAVLGLDFSSFGKKPTVDLDKVGLANKEVAAKTTGVNAIIGIAESGIPLMEAVGSSTGKQVLTVHKEKGGRNLQDGACAVVVPGFTSVGDRIFRYDLSELYNALAKINGITPYQVFIMAQRDQLDLLVAPSVKVSEDIFHTGTVLDAIFVLNERLWQSMGVRLNVTNIAAWFGMTYGGYEQVIRNTFGISPEPVLKIRSLGLRPEPWVEFDMPGLEGYALTYERSYQG